jgi:hypothetical protein
MSSYVGITRTKSDHVLRNMVARGLLEPDVAPRPVQRASDAEIIATSVHEAAHAVALLLLQARITEVVVNDSGSGHCHGQPPSGLGVPKPSEPRAILHAASDFIGVLAVARAYGYKVETDDDFHRLGGATDIKHIYGRAALLGCDRGQADELRRSALAMARAIIDEYGQAIDAIADDLSIYRGLAHDGVISAVKRTPCADRLLAGQAPTIPDRAPTEPLPSRQAWNGELRECEPHAVVVIDHNGCQTPCPNLDEAFRLLSRDFA